MFSSKTSDVIVPLTKHKNIKLASEILHKIEEAVATSNDQLVIKQLIEYRDVASV